MIISLISVCFSGCKKENNGKYTESWIEWEEEVDGTSGDDSDAVSGDKSSKGSNSGKIKSTQAVPPVADEKYFPKDWVNARAQYEKAHNPYNIPAKLRAQRLPLQHGLIIQNPKLLMRGIHLKKQRE